MTTLIRKAAFGAALAAAATMASAPADARDYYRYGRHHDRTGTAIAAGIVGLAIGAAIASSSNDRYYRGGRYYDDGYYYPRYNSGYNYNSYPGYYNYPRYDSYRYRQYYRDRYYRDRNYRYGW